MILNTPKESKFCSRTTKRRIKSGNACYHSVRNLLSFSVLSKNVKIYGNIILSLVLYGRVTWSLTVTEDVG
jgi:hypothetical protein